MEDMNALRQRMLRNVLSDSPTADNDCKITPAQWELLHAAAKKDGSSIKELAAALGVSSSAATQTVDALEKKGMVRRSDHPDDRRATLVRLRPDLRERMERVHSGIAKTFRDAFAALDDDELKTYASLIRKVAGARIDEQA